MNHASLFSGIGGFDLAAHWMGWNNVFNCDIEEFPRKVLKHHFPHAIQYADIKQTDFTIHAGQVDILSGGFPCQPFSVAGKRLGKNDERHLWPEMYRAIQEIRPRYIVGENVRGLLSWNDGMVLDQVYTDLENEGYEVLTFVLPAASVNAPHKRDRVWIIAHNSDTRTESMRSTGKNKVHGSENASDTKSIGYRGCPSQRGEEKQYRILQGEQERSQVGSKTQGCSRSWADFPTQSPLCGGDDGIPRELDSLTFPKWRKESIKAYGNAIVPQIAYRIFQSINLTNHG